MPSLPGPLTGGTIQLLLLRYVEASEIAVLSVALWEKRTTIEAAIHNSFGFLVLFFGGGGGGFIRTFVI